MAQASRPQILLTASGVGFRMDTGAPAILWGVVAREQAEIRSDQRA